MENKQSNIAGYYVPELSEFHKGFEFEKYIDGDFDTHTHVGWQKEIADWSDIEEAFDDDEHQNEIFGDLYRVKYLDKEDIESLGWIPIKDIDNEFVKLAKLGEGHNTWLYVLPERKIRIINSHREDVINTTATIKNKSELKILLTQLNIE